MTISSRIAAQGGQAPCPICGHYKTLVIITECEPPPLPDVRRAAGTLMV